MKSHSAQLDHTFVILWAVLAVVALSGSPAKGQNLYVSDNNDNTIIQFALSGGSSTVVNTGSLSLSEPRGLAIVGTNLYIANVGNSQIDVVSLAGGTPSLLTTTGFSALGEGLAASSSTLYIGNDSGLPVVSVPLSGGTVTNIATSPNTVEDSYALVLDGSSNLYVADVGNNRVLDVSLSTGTSTILGTGALTLNSPAGLAIDSSNNLYVSNESANTIDVIPISGGTPYQLNTGSLTLSTPRGLLVIGNNLFVANQGNNTVDEISLTGGTDSVFATVTSPTNLAVSAAPTLTSAYWLGNTNGSWTGYNWATTSSGTSTLGTPSSGTDVTFSATGATNETTTLGGNTTIKSLTINDPNAVTIGGTYTLAISGTSGTTGIIVNSGAGLATISSNVVLAGSSGTITVSNTAGAAISGNITGSIGLIKTGTGTLTLSGTNTYTGGTTIDAGTLAVSGTGASITHTSDSLVVGNVSGDNGTLLISNGGKVSSAYGDIGVSSGATGSVTVTGVNANGVASSWTNTSGVIVGDSGTGILNVQNGGQVSVGNLEDLVLGAGSTGNGTATVSGVNSNGTASTLNASSQLYLGYTGTATLSVQNGGQVTSNIVYLGYNASTSSGSLTVSGVSSTGTVSTLSSSTTLDVGYKGTGALNIQDGGKVTDLTGILGGIAGSKGMATVTGTNANDTASTWTSTGLLEVGASGTGTLTISNGGLVNSSSTYLALNSGSQGTLKLNSGGVLATSSVNIQTTGGTINFNGGILRATADSSDFIVQPTSYSVLDDIVLGSGGGTIDTNGHAVTLNANLTGTGGFTKAGAGTLTLTSAHDYTGATEVSGGTLTFAYTNILPSTTALIVDAGGTIDLATTVQTVGSLAGGGTVALSGGYLQVTENNVTTTFSGSISDSDPTYGGLAKDGNGNLILTGSNAFSGGTFIQSGTLTIQGTGATLTQAKQDLQIGSYSGVSATLLVSSGGQVASKTGYIGLGPSSIGVAGVSGTGSVWNITNGLYLGYRGTGALTVSNGGLVSSAFVSMNGTGGSPGALELDSNGILATGYITAIDTPPHLSSINFNGGIVRATADSTDFIHIATVGLASGGGIIDTNSHAITVNAAFAGTGGLTKEGTGVLTLTNTSTYTGSTIVNGGTLSVNLLGNGGNASGIGQSSNAASNLVLNGGTFQFANDGYNPLFNSGVTDRQFTLGINGGTIDASGNEIVNFTNAGSVAYSTANVAEALTLAGSNANINILNAAVGDNGTGATSIVKTGTGEWELTGTNTYSGGTSINQGILLALSSSSLGTGAITFGGGTLQYASGVTTDVSGQIKNSTQSIVVDTNGNTLTTYSGNLDSSNIGGLNKTGAGTLALTGTNTYTGGTTVSGGKLAVEGSVTGNVTTQTGAEVGGHGTIGGTIGASGSVGPADSPGILTAASTDPTGGLSYNFEFTQPGSPTWSTAAASGNDVLHLTAALPFTSALTSSNAINLYFDQSDVTFEGGFFVNGSTDDLSANIADATYNYYLLDNTSGTILYNGNYYDTVTGQVVAHVIQVTGANFADGTVNGYTQQFQISSSAVPEPSTWTMIFGGLVLLAFCTRIRRVSITPTFGKSSDLRSSVID